jgi:hypothetical protein
MLRDERSLAAGEMEVALKAKRLGPGRRFTDL